MHVRRNVGYWHTEMLWLLDGSLLEWGWLHGCKARDSPINIAILVQGLMRYKTMWYNAEWLFRWLANWWCSKTWCMHNIGFFLPSGSVLCDSCNSPEALIIDQDIRRWKFSLKKSLLICNHTQKVHLQGRSKMLSNLPHRLSVVLISH